MRCDEADRLLSAYLAAMRKYSTAVLEMNELAGLDRKKEFDLVLCSTDYAAQRLAQARRALREHGCDLCEGDDLISSQTAEPCIAKPWSNVGWS